MTDETAPEILEGRLEVQVVAAGSKSEMTAVVLVGDDPKTPPVTLRRPDAPGLSADPQLTELAGRRVRVQGRRAWSTFVVEGVDLLD